VPVALLLSPEAEDWRSVLALLAGNILVVPAWRFNVPRIDGWTALLHDPRVYGMLLVWGVLVVTMMRNAGAEAPGPSAAMRSGGPK